jgi:beta-N-acetylhexosaminidase
MSHRLDARHGLGPHRPAVVAVLALVVVLVAAVVVVAIRTTQAERPAATSPGAEQRCDPLAAVGQLPLRRRLAQLVMVGVDPSGPGRAREVVAAEQVGGIFIGGTATGLLSGGALAEVHRVAELPLAVAVDEEGGRVQRIDQIAGSIPSARRMAATLTPQQVEELARERGTRLRASGVTIDFAPTVDVSSQPDGDVIGDRSFAADPAVVVRYAGAFARGLRSAGVLPVFKHFPGHGRAEGDSHTGAATTPPVAELRRSDMVPYRHLLGTGADAVMIGHLDVPGLTAPSAPASISPAAVAMLREEFGYRGLVISDDLGAMRAITDRVDLPEAVRRSLAAGVDLALSMTGDRIGEVLDHLEQAVATGALSRSRIDEAVVRVLNAKGVDPCLLP